MDASTKSAFWKIMKFILLLPFYTAFAIVWGGIMPALIIGFGSAAVKTIWKMI